MVIVKLIGGLGNQMFQYAAGRSLAAHLETFLKLDKSSYLHSPNRSYALHHYRIQEDIATPDEIYAFTGNPQTRTQRIKHGVKLRLISALHAIKIMNSLVFKPTAAKYIETHFHFDNNFFSQNGNVYLHGYWQSEKYFKRIENIIRNDFTLKEPLDSKNKEFAEQISSCDSVSVHIRRGDYISNPKTKSVHGVCLSDYYSAATTQISKLIDKPHFFVFSDDPGWVARYFNISHPTTIVSHNGPQAAHSDLTLISFCKHHIIANSSFSWWGAWLNPNSQKVVIAPKRWFNTTRNITKDLIPDGWISL